MNHLITRKTGAGIEAHYSHPSQPNHSVPLSFRRITIGMIYPQASTRSARTLYAYAVVVGERVRETFEQRDQGLPWTRSYLAIDELEGTDSDAFYKGLVELKDRYLVSTIFCANNPVTSLDALRNYEGLTHYNEEAGVFIRQRWPSYVDKLTVAAIHEMAIPEFGVISQDLNNILREEVKDSATNFPVLSQNAKIIHRLMFAENLNTKKIREAMGTSNQFRMTALWLAVMGMENTERWHPTNKNGWQHRPGQGGY